MSDKLTGKKALVTGGSRGIGAAIARGLAEEGADVAISYQSAANKAEAVVRYMESLGVKSAAFQADQGDSAQVESLVHQAAKTLGGLDILVNSAGVFVTGAVDDPDAAIADFERQFAVNVGGVATAVRTASRIMNEGGRIISIGTTGASRAPFGGIGDYVASKAAVAAYTRAWARDLGSKGITVNVVQPGAIDTDMNPATSAHAAMLNSLAALGRYGTPKELADVVVFLAGPGGSYITGATINVDGGQTT